MTKFKLALSLHQPPDVVGGRSGYRPTSSVCRRSAIRFWFAGYAGSRIDGAAVRGGQLFGQDPRWIGWKKYEAV